MLTIWEARRRIAGAAVAITERQRLPLTDAAGRIMAERAIATVSAPPADNSAMDGFAFAAVAAANAKPLRISQTIKAGDAPQPLSPGTAARIFTGAEIPSGADTVAMQENCEVLGNEVSLREGTVAGANIRPLGQDFLKGDVLVHAGQLLNAARLGLLAAAGVSEVALIRAPRVAIINTGNELAEPGAPLRAGQIYNSNATMLRALLSSWGCHVVQQIHVADDLQQTEQALCEAAAHADLVITSGGVSVGDEDHVRAAIARLGKIELWKVCIKPGKPLAFGFIADRLGCPANRHVPVIGLPGNPVSSYVSALLFVKAFINGLYGREYQEPQALMAPATFSINRPQQRPEFVRARWSGQGLTLHKNQSSGVLSSLAWANSLALIDPARLPIAIGDPVPFYFLNQLTAL